MLNEPRSQYILYFLLNHNSNSNNNKNNNHLLKICLSECARLELNEGSSDITIFIFKISAFQG